MSDLPIQIVRVSVQEMQRMFNEGQYREHVESGKLTAKVNADRHPALPLANEPFCTRSQEVSYLDVDGNEVARVHQYLRADGSIGLSGKPDPKRMFVDGVLYRLQKAK